MKTQTKFSKNRGFTLLELMVAMAITAIIVTILVSITSISLDTWNRSRAETRAARQAKSMVDTIAHDLESMVSRKGNSYDWLYAAAADKVGPNSNQSTNAAKLTFFTAATDRYEGMIGDETEDKGGDVSCVSYRLAYQDPIKDDSKENLSTFVLYRMLVNPDETFKNLIGQEDLDTAFTGLYSENDVSELKNFVCENVFQFSVTFNVTVSVTTGSTTESRVIPVTICENSSNSQVNLFQLKGTTIKSTFGGADGVSAEQFAAGKISSVEVSLTVLTDAGIEQLRRRNFSGQQKAEFLTKNSFQYSKLIQIPGM